MVRRLFQFIALSALVIPNAGCMTAAKRAFKEALGATSKVVEVPGMQPSELAIYRDIEVAPVHSNLGGLVDSLFLSSLPGLIRQYAHDPEEPVFRGGSPVLTLDPEVMFYTDRGAIGEVLGSDTYAVVLYHLRGNGGAVGRLEVVTKSAASHTDGRDMAESNAKTLAAYFRKLKEKSGKQGAEPAEHETSPPESPPPSSDKSDETAPPEADKHGG